MPRSSIPKVFKKRSKSLGSGKIRKEETTEATTVTHECTTTPEDTPLRTNRSAEKLVKGLAYYQNLDCYNEYDIVDMTLLNRILSKIGVCKSCHGPIEITVSNRKGLAATMSITCSHCQNVETGPNCSKISGDNGANFYDLNIRLVYGMRAIGVGHEPTKLFCGIMNLPPPHSLYQKHIKFMSSKVQEVSASSMRRAVQETVDELKSKDICVAVDGTWQKRGHSSLNGVVAATSATSGKVVDVEVISKYCRCPERLKSQHLDTCTANFLGTSGQMEVFGAKQIFSRSVEKYGVRYTSYLGDGDSKGFLAVQEMAPYGETTITKEECVGHVQKRMGTRLRKLVESMKGKKLADKKPIGGSKNRLTKENMGLIQTYYGLAIRRNTGDLLEMKKAVWSIFFHLISTNDNPKHGLCHESWCKYKSTEENYDHNDHNHILELVMNQTKPIFSDLAEEKLLEKCLLGRTQNPNESFNNVVWKRIPKNTFVMIATLQFGVHDAVLCFNDGNRGRCELFLKMRISPGAFFVKEMERRDVMRKKEAEKNFEEIEKKARESRNRAKRRLEDMYEAEEGEPSYSGGAF